jgi:hypothetical protein
MVSLPTISIDCRCGASRREGVARPERCPTAAATIMRPPPVPGHRNRLGPACARQGSSVAACGCRTKLENAHGIFFRVHVYPWHPWFGMQVAIHEVVDKADGAVFRCTLSGSRSDRGLEVPAWMFDRLCCPDRVHLTEAPFVSAGALEALSAVLGMASKASLSSSNPLFSGASNVSRDQNPGECDATEDSDAAQRRSAGFASDTPTMGLVRGQPARQRRQRARMAGVADGSPSRFDRADGAADATACREGPDADREGGRP